MHKEVKQATSGPASLGVTGEGGSNPQLSSVKLASHSELFFSASTIIHSESTSGYDASADSTTEADPSKSTPNDSLSKQQGSAKGTQNYSIDHIIACAYPNVLVDKTQSAGDRSNDTTKDIKLKDLSKLIKDVGIDLMDLDLIEDDQSFIVQSDEEEEEVHAEPNAETKDTSLEKAQAAAKAKASLFKAQPSFLNFKQLIELLVQSLKHELLKLLTYRDFSASLPKELKELPYNFNEISREIRDLKQYVEGLEIEILGDLKEIHAKLDEFQSSVSGMKEMDRYRCTLRPETVEALYCAKDWLRSEIFVNMDSVVKMEFPI
ncbi:hypothetical protein Tco_0445938 [Tanacetum coccineum]